MEKNSFEIQAKSFIPLEVPYEDESKTYIKSLSLSSPKEIHDFFTKYGFVVISNVLLPEECEKSVKEVYADLTANSFDKFDPKSENYDKVDRFVKRFGLIGGGYPVFMPQSILNRQNEKIYLAYKYATAENYFLSAFERYGFMVPTKKAPGMETIKNWLHIDYNPITGQTSTFGYIASDLYSKLTPEKPLSWQNAYFQGIVALEDCPEEVGGFHCVPGFHAFCEQWKELNKEQCLSSAEGMDPTTVQIPEEDEIRKNIKKIPIRKGSLLIWDGRLAHGNFPNNSEKPRLVQYIKFNAVGPHIQSNVFSIFSSQSYEEELNLVKSAGISELGKKLFGMEKWWPEQILTVDEKNK